MCSNFGNFTPEDLASDTSQISTEDEFVCVKRPKMKEIGTMTVKMDIPKVEQNTVLNDSSHRARLIPKLIYRFKNVKEDTNKAQKFISWLRNCFASINKNCLNSILHGILAFLTASLFFVFFLLILSGFWIAFTTIVSDPNLGKSGPVLALLSTIFLLSFVHLAFLFLYKIIRSCRIFSAKKDLITSIFNKYCLCWNVIFFLIIFVFIVVLFFLIFEYIIFGNFSKNYFFTNRFITAILALLGLLASLIAYFSVLYLLLNKCRKFGH
uniref:Uncharacterized protein n=1 Tax=Meloidogyne enterolobii TaxID=390850 RepID=A0A6V7UL48_MELEN|nr:unnamed protein product [Meloidogyne enterolobii]